MPITHPSIHAATGDVVCLLITVLAGTYAVHVVADRDVVYFGTAGAVTIDGAGTGRPLTVTSGTVELHDITVTGGDA